MHPHLIMLHSVLRWLILLAMLITLYRSYTGWKSGRAYTSWDNRWKKITVSAIHIQFLVGLVMYFLSPVVSYFWKNFSTAVKERDIRFFGMEHLVAMTIAVVLVTIGSSKVKRLNDSRAKFKTLTIWFTIALIIIFLSIPWPFMFTERPYFRF
ncbi:MAG: hypothetical protein KIT80_07460 [Chitinophagaceae bacterium]|nr:hypothetical protein [Chitinophagaceae bacterium]MCW5926729.1 hypothetical protein [Chitinophagaceae bacterium]